MDVVCDRCNTEYEFDDALVSERGTTVKCTTCGHQFRIFRPKSEGAARPWTLKRTDGKTATFDSLAVLQRWIAESKASRADLLSRDGVEWKTLGSIAELEGFFAQADAKARAGRSVTPPPPTPSGPPVVPAIPPPSPAARRGTAQGLGQVSGPPPSRPPIPSLPPLPPMPAAKPPSLPSVPAPAATGAATLFAGTESSPPSGIRTQGASGFRLDKSSPPDGAATPPTPPTPPLADPAGRSHIATPAPASRASRPTPGSKLPSRSAPPSADGYSLGASSEDLPAESYDLGDDTGIMERWNTDTAGSAPAPASRPGTPAKATASSRPHTTSRPAVTEPPPEPGPASIPPPRSPSNARTVFIAIGAVGLVVGGALTAWKISQPAPVATTAPPRTSPVVQDPVTLALTDIDRVARDATRGGFDDAKDRLTAMLLNPAHRDDPRLLAARAAILAARGEASRIRADELEARAARGGTNAATLRAEATLVRGSASADIERARTDSAAAESSAARVSNGDRGRFERALADVARIVRADLPVARQHAAAARAAGADTAVIDGLIARDAAEIDAAIASLRRAVDGPEPDGRARLALARIFASRGDRAAANEQLQALLRVQPQHDDGQSLSTAIEAGLPPFRPASAAVATGPTPSVVTPPPGPAIPLPGISTGTTGTTGTGGAAPPSGVWAGRTYDSLVGEGERLRERGQIERARGAFMAALGQRSDGCEAVAGLAFVEMRSGQNPAAILLFRRAIGLNGRYSDAYFGLGQAYERSGDNEQAVRAYRQYLQVNPGGLRAREAQGRLDALDRPSTPRPPAETTAPGNGPSATQNAPTTEPSNNPSPSTTGASSAPETPSATP